MRRIVGLYSDLYCRRPRGRATSPGSPMATIARSGPRRPMGARLSPFGRDWDRRELVTFAMPGRAPASEPDRQVVLSEPDTQFNAPRWSPDGRSIAVERHRPGATPRRSWSWRSARVPSAVIASAPGTRHVTPTWRPDGGAVIVRRRCRGRAVQSLRDRARRPGPCETSADTCDRRRHLA